MSHAAKVLRAVRNTARRQAFPGGTKRALIDHAAQLFGEHGYSGTSLDEVVAAAKVTKGALYHHFSSKLALFESVFLQVQAENVERIEAAMRGTTDPWQRAEAGLSAFFEACRDPHYRRICIQEAPAALGVERFRDAERTATLALVTDLLGALLDEIGVSRSQTDAFAAILYGAVREVGAFVADAEDPAAATESSALAISSILAGMRATAR